MDQVVTQDIHLTTDRVLDVLMEKILSPDGLIPTPQPSRRERWVPVHDIQRSMGIGVAGIGGRLLGLVGLLTSSGHMPYNY